jgi:hypothetical protein
VAKIPSYTVSDGRLMLTLRKAGKGWYAVTSPLDPELITQAKSLPEAFAMAYDAKKTLDEARRKRFKRLAGKSA